MDRININKDFSFTRDDLLGLGIYDLRELGRDVGVCSPTTLKKENLVDAILAVVYGEAPKRRIGKGRGRPTRRAEKPSKLFLDLVEKSNAPKLETSFVYDNNDEEFGYNNYPYASKVASTTFDYNRENNASDSVLKRGIVCFDVKDYAVVRNYRFVPSEKDVVVPAPVIDKYRLKDNDLIEYILDAENRVGQVIKINGNLIADIDDYDLVPAKPVKKEVISLSHGANIETGASSIITAESLEDRRALVELAVNKMRDKGNIIVKVCYETLAPTGKNVMTDKLIEYYVTMIGDEYESIILTEQAINKVKMLSSSGASPVLVLDDLSWLLKVVNSYPKALYGTFIQKLARLSQTANATVVCVSKPLSKEAELPLSELFNIIK